MVSLGFCKYSPRHVTSGPTLLHLVANLTATAGVYPYSTPSKLFIWLTLAPEWQPLSKNEAT